MARKLGTLWLQLSGLIWQKSDKIRKISVLRISNMIKAIWWMLRTVWNFLSASGNALLAIVTFCLVIATFCTLREMKIQTALQQESYMPVQRAYFQINSRIEYFPRDFEKRLFLDSIYIYTTFDNIGQTPAYTKLLIHGAEKYDLEKVNTVDSLRKYSVTDRRKPSGNIDYKFANFIPPKSSFTRVDTMRHVLINADNHFYYHLAIIYEDIFRDWHVLYQVTPFLRSGYMSEYEAAPPNIKQEILTGDFRKYIELLANINEKSP